MTIWTPERKPGYSRFLTVNRDAPLGVGDDIVALWLMNEGGGNLIRDISGHGNDGVINGALWQPGRDLTALEFDGNTNRITVPHDDVFNFGTDPFSVSCWINISTTEADVGWIIDKEVADQSKGIVLAISGGSNQIIFMLREGARQVRSDDTLNDGKWHHIVAVRAAASGANSLLLYVDGELQAITDDANNSDVDNSANLTIGAYTLNNANNLDGTLSEICIWHRGLTAGQVLQLYTEPYSLVTEQFPKTYFFFRTISAAPSISSSSSSSLSSSQSSSCSSSSSESSSCSSESVSSSSSESQSSSSSSLSSSCSSESISSSSSSISSSCSSESQSSSSSSLSSSCSSESVSSSSSSLSSSCSSISISSSSSSLSSSCSSESVSSSSSSVSVSSSCSSVSVSSSSSSQSSSCSSVSGSSSNSSLSSSSSSESVSSSSSSISSSSSQSLSSSSSSSAVQVIQTHVLWTPEMTVWTPERKPKYSRFLTVNRDAPLGVGDDVVALWLMNEGGGNSIRDISGHGNDGVITGALWQPGRDTTALDLDGGTDRITVQHHGSFNFGTDPFSISCWINIATTEIDNAFVVDKENVGGTNGFAFGGTILPTEFIFLLRGGVGYATSDGALNDGKWHHIVGVRTAVSGANSILLYVDGELQANTGDANSVDVDNSANLTIGAYTLNDGHNLDGTLSDICIWHRGLTAGQVLQLYAEPYCVITEQFPKMYFFFQTSSAAPSVSSSSSSSSSQSSTSTSLSSSSSSSESSYRQWVPLDGSYITQEDLSGQYDTQEDLNGSYITQENMNGRWPYMILQDLSLPRGDGRDYRLTVLDENANIFSLTGATLTFTVKENESQGDAAAAIQLSSANASQIDIDDPGNGKALIHVRNAHTQGLQLLPYIYDVQVKTSANAIRTVTKGILAIVSDVTRTV